LLSAVPAISKQDKAARSSATPAGGTDALGPSGQTGCAFAARCPWRIDNLCETTPPPTQVTGAGASISCHIRLDELERLTGWKCGMSAE
jgi:peptide/nickel transport system ATP-binding protein